MLRARFKAALLSLYAGRANRFVTALKVLFFRIRAINQLYYSFVG